MSNLKIKEMNDIGKGHEWDINLQDGRSFYARMYYGMLVVEGAVKDEGVYVVRLANDDTCTITREELIPHLEAAANGDTPPAGTRQTGYWLDPNSSGCADGTMYCDSVDVCFLDHENSSMPDEWQAFEDALNRLYAGETKEELLAKIAAGDYKLDDTWGLNSTRSFEPYSIPNSDDDALTIMRGKEGVFDLADTANVDEWRSSCEVVNALFQS